MLYILFIAVYLLIRFTVYPEVYKLLFPFGLACLVITAIFGMTYYSNWGNFFASLSFVCLVILFFENVFKRNN